MKQGPSKCSPHLYWRRATSPLSARHATNHNAGSSVFFLSFFLSIRFFPSHLWVHCIHWGRAKKKTKDIAKTDKKCPSSSVHIVLSHGHATTHSNADLLVRPSISQSISLLVGPSICHLVVLKFRPVYCSVFPPPRGGGGNNQRVWRKGRKRKEEKREKKENLGKI